MLFLHEYIAQFRDEETEERIRLADRLEEVKATFDVFLEGRPLNALQDFVDTYNWLGSKDTKQEYSINQNLARNLPGALMQDFLLHLVIWIGREFPTLDAFTEVRVPFGRYPLWSNGRVFFSSPCEQSDIAAGYLLENGEPVINEEPWPKQPFYRLNAGQSVAPLLTLNSKIRVSQSEFFDWLGRETLMTKGNPHCLSIQVALRKEMDMNIVEASQADDKFFLIGTGGEGRVVPRPLEFERLVEVIHDHFADAFAPHPV